MSGLLLFPMPVKYAGFWTQSIDVAKWRTTIRNHKYLGLLTATTWPTLKIMMSVFEEEVLRRMYEEGLQKITVVDSDGVADGRIIRPRYKGIDVEKGRSGAAGTRIKDVLGEVSEKPW